MSRKKARSEVEPEVNSIIQEPSYVDYPMYVANCTSVRIRKLASIDSPVIKVIQVRDVVYADLSFTNDEFFKIRTSDGVEGFIMKPFLTKEPPGVR